MTTPDPSKPITLTMAARSARRSHSPAKIPSSPVAIAGNVLNNPSGS